uniref:Methane monooxygenase component C n=1 Tax=Methylosinus trichosporium TaxID=426 RepID=MMOC_METTR|nr:RecName: Full=Methane monooxygenase component C; AltName: Full=Methane hydroxylase; AltName: Full=Methane monooxygenase reductase; Short=MMOR [Methylosinus trichosporium]AAB21393.1 Protein C [Methylosinus trichosporium]
MYQIVIETEDGETCRRMRPSEDWISRAEAERNLLASCRAGCATCKADCTDGDYELIDVKVQAVPPDEEEDGKVLLCRTFPRSDLHLLVPYTYDRISFEAIQTNWLAEILACDRVSSNVVRLVLQRSRPMAARISLNFVPGQFVDIEIPGTHTRRSYSMASVAEDGQLEFIIRLLPDGAFSKFLQTEAKVGMRVDLRGPAGSFFLHDHGGRSRVFVAGGTGLSPVLSMIRQLGKASDPSPATLLFGVTNREELFYVDELKTLAQSMPTLGVRIAVVNDDGGNGVDKGTVIDLLRAELEIDLLLGHARRRRRRETARSCREDHRDRCPAWRSDFLEKFLASG